MLRLGRYEHKALCDAKHLCKHARRIAIVVILVALHHEGGGLADYLFVALAGLCEVDLP